MDWFLNGHPVEGEQASRPRGVDVVRDVPTCGADDRLAEVVGRAGAGTTVVVVNDRGVVVGLLTGEADAGDGSGLVADAMRPGPGTFRPGVPVADLVEHLDGHGAAMALLTTSDGCLVGAVHRHDLEAVTPREG